MHKLDQDWIHVQTSMKPEELDDWARIDCMCRERGTIIEQGRAFLIKDRLAKDIDGWRMVEKYRVVAVPLGKPA